MFLLEVPPPLKIKPCVYEKIMKATVILFVINFIKKLIYFEYSIKLLFVSSVCLIMSLKALIGNVW